MEDLTPKQLLSVPCPTCGVDAGSRCLLRSGAPRAEPHVDRKLSAADVVDRKKERREHGRRFSTSTPGTCLCAPASAIQAQERLANKVRV